MAATKRKTSKKVIFGLLALLVLIIAGVSFFGSRNRTLKVAVEEVSSRSIVETVTANGKIYPRNEVVISPEVRGEILQILVEEGDSVVMGDTLILIDPEIYQTDVDRSMATVLQSKANLAQMRAAMATSKAQFDAAQTAFRRQKKLHEKGVISDLDMETATSTFKSSEAGLESARQNVIAMEYSLEISQAVLDQALKQLEFTTITAPVNGIVSQLSVKEGERVIGTSQMQGTELLKIADLNFMEVHVDVGENDVIRVTVGDTAMVEVDAYLDRKFMGEVIRIASSANNMGGLGSAEQVTNFKVKVQLLPESFVDILEARPGTYPFRPGMNATVDIQTDTKVDVPAVPIQAVTTREDKDSTTEATGMQEVVFVREGNTVKVLQVKTGLQDDEYIQLVEGPEVGAEVVKAPFAAISRELEDGMEIEVVDESVLFKEE